MKIMTIADVFQVIRNFDVSEWSVIGLLFVLPMVIGGITIYYLWPTSNTMSAPIKEPDEIPASGYSIKKFNDRTVEIIYDEYADTMLAEIDVNGRKYMVAKSNESLAITQLKD